MKLVERGCCAVCYRRDDSSDSEHGSRRSRQTRTAPAAAAAAAPALSSSSSRPTDRQHHPVTPSSRQCVDQVVATTGTNSVYQRQCVRDDSVDSSSTWCGGTRCLASPPTSLNLHAAARHQQLNRRALVSGGALLRRRLAPETCV